MSDEVIWTAEDEALCSGEFGLVKWLEAELTTLRERHAAELAAARRAVRDAMERDGVRALADAVCSLTRPAEEVSRG